MASIVQADYDQLDKIRSSFQTQGDQIYAMALTIAERVNTLKADGWQGRGADAFFTEMDDEIMPALHRLREAFYEAEKATLQINLIIKEAEEEAANVFKSKQEFDIGSTSTITSFSATASTGSDVAPIESTSQNITVTGELLPAEGQPKEYIGKPVVVSKEIVWVAYDKSQKRYVRIDLTETPRAEITELIKSDPDLRLPPTKREFIVYEQKLEGVYKTDDGRIVIGTYKSYYTSLDANSMQTNVLPGYSITKDRDENGIPETVVKTSPVDASRFDTFRLATEEEAAKYK